MLFALQGILGSSTDCGSTVVAVVSIVGCVTSLQGSFLRMLVQLSQSILVSLRYVCFCNCHDDDDVGDLDLN